MSTTYSDLERRVTSLTETVGNLTEADGRQRDALVRTMGVLREVLAGNPVAPGRVAYALTCIEEALGTDGFAGQQQDHWNCKQREVAGA